MTRDTLGAGGEVPASLDWKIEEIPGEDIGWRPSARSEFNQLAVHLLRAGLTAEQVVDQLTRIYWEVADTYGG
jgi:hypothetical protein